MHERDRQDDKSSSQLCQDFYFEGVFFIFFLLFLTNGSVGGGPSSSVLPANTACDPVIEEHFRRSLGKNYKEPEPVATNSLSITGSVDDHFAKALGETWLQIKNKGSPSSSSSSPNSSPDTHMLAHSHSPSVLS